MILLFHLEIFQPHQSSMFVHLMFMASTSRLLHLSTDRRTSKQEAMSLYQRSLTRRLLGQPALSKHPAMRALVKRRKEAKVAAPMARRMSQAGVPYGKEAISFCQHFRARGLTCLNHIDIDIKFVQDMLSFFCIPCSSWIDGGISLIFFSCAFTIPGGIKKWPRICTHFSSISLAVLLRNIFIFILFMGWSKHNEASWKASAFLNLFVSHLCWWIIIIR